jgi:putative endonuclease
MDYSKIQKLNHKELGNWGEEIAAKYLLEQGYQIQEKNYRCKQGEIDLIALDGRVLVFIEVKTRRNSIYGLPQEAIDKRKINRLFMVAQNYLHINKLVNQNCRFDVVNILFKDKKYEVDVIKNAISF